MNLDTTMLKLFLAHGGKALWRTDEQSLTEKQIQEDYLLPNGIIAEKILLQKDIAFVEVNPEKTHLEDFYTWEEALTNPARPECWRTYWFFTDTQGAEWFSSRFLQGENEVEGRPIHEYYEEILTFIN